MHIPSRGILKKKKDHYFAIHMSITHKISKDLSEILAMLRAKFCAIQWSPGGENRDRTKKTV